MTIKEVEQHLEVPRATVRFYEKEGLINPQRGENGYREYSEEDVTRLRDEKEEIHTFEAEKYWNVIEEEEKKGNRFLDIAKDMAHYEKGILLEFFNIADREGNLSVGIGQMFLNVSACLIVYVVVRCLLDQDWSLQSVLGGVRGLVFLLVLELLVGIPIFLVGRKRPEVLQKRNKIMFWSFTALFVLCILVLILCRIFGW